LGNAALDQRTETVHTGAVGEHVADDDLAFFTGHRAAGGNLSVSEQEQVVVNVVLALGGQQLDAFLEKWVTADHCQ
jgi:hypothetical protein